MDTPFDEALLPDGTPRAHYGPLMEQLDGMDLGALRERVDAGLRRDGCRFADGDFVIDPIPRLLTAQEWAALEVGLEQRAQVLEAFTADVYGERAAIAAGVVPERVLDGAAYLERDVVGLETPTWIGIAGLDLVRGADGRFRVLEDNLRTPSGLAYALAAREAIGRALELPETLDPVEPAVRLLREALVAAAPAGCGDDPVIVVVSDGPSNAAFWEHQQLAAMIGVPIVTPQQLRRRGPRLAAHVDGRDIGVDVIYRRTDEDRLRGDDGELTPLAELVLEPQRRGTLSVVNCGGAGVADDKLVYPYVPALTRFLLGEEPLLEQVPTFDLMIDAQRAEALERIDELVVKPRDAYGGVGVVVCPHAESRDIRAAADAIRADPDVWIAQETVSLSTHPTVIDGALAPRHVDLRPFVVVAAGEARAIPGGLTRVAMGAGELIVNSSQGGGAKDTAVLV